jgi:GTP cyclohydrolase II
MQNNRYKLARTIADIRNGFCMLIVKNASKTFYFAKNTIHPDVLTTIPNCEIVTTKELYNFINKNENSNFNVVLKNDMSFSCNANDSDNMAIQITKIAEIQPVLFKITDPNYTPEVPFETINYDDIDFAIKNFQYELTFLAKAKIHLSIAQNCEIYAFGSKHGGHQHYAILVNSPLLEQTPLVRVHSSCYTGDLISSLRCDCGDQLKNAIIEMNKTSGILLYIMQEGRGIGLANKIKAYEFQQECGLDTVESNLALGFEDEERSFVPAAEILKFLKKTEINLMTNNPKKAEDLTQNGITVKSLKPTYFNPHKENEEYLQVKKAKMGHIL